DFHVTGVQTCALPISGRPQTISSISRGAAAAPQAGEAPDGQGRGQPRRCPRSKRASTGDVCELLIAPRGGSRCGWSAATRAPSGDRKSGGQGGWVDRG